jgi:hypothetical protein
MSPLEKAKGLFPYVFLIVCGIILQSQKGSELVEKIIMVAFSVAASILVGAYISYVIRSIGESSQTVTKTGTNPL